MIMCKGERSLRIGRRPPFYERRLSDLRALNTALPPDKRFHVFAIDPNEEVYGGAAGFRDLAEYLADLLPVPGPLRGALDDGYATDVPSEQTAAVDRALAELGVDRDSLTQAWGPERCNTVVELFEVERLSIQDRATRLEDDNDGARAREEIIKQLAEHRVTDCECRTVINIGGHHAQKSRLMGTSQEWLGDYLVHRSAAAGGSDVVIGFSAARTVLEPGRVRSCRPTSLGPSTFVRPQCGYG